jgi:hypothetical protein
MHHLPSLGACPLLAHRVPSSTANDWYSPVMAGFASLDVSNESSHTAGQGGFLRRLLATVVRQLVCANGRAPVGVTGAASAYRG